MKKIDFSYGNLDDAVILLQNYKKIGINSYIDFGRYRLYSSNVTLDSAYLEVVGCTRNEYLRAESKYRDEYLLHEKEMAYSDFLFDNMVIFSRMPNNDVIITKEMIINGLKFIAENQDIDQVKLVEGLIKLGCNFILGEIDSQFQYNGLLVDGISSGELACGAYVIACARDSKYGRNYIQNIFLDFDDDVSIYHFIRIITGDKNYTKNNIICSEEKRKEYLKKIYKLTYTKK